MPPLNPFLRAFFSSRLPAQCVPPSQYILLIPTTELLLTCRDRDTQSSYVELATAEDLIACHVLRVPTESSLPAKDRTVTLRDSKGKARQYSTLNSRTVVIKDSIVYSNKGFKTLVQAKLLRDAVYHQDAPDSPQWLLYYISQPLAGTPVSLDATDTPDFGASSSDGARHGSRKDQQGPLTNFTDLMGRFPIITRQIRPGLDKLFHQTRLELELITVDAAVETSKQSSVAESAKPRRRSNSASSIISLSSRVSSLSKYDSHEITWEENQMRRAIENLVLSAIDLFQAVDQQQLSLLGTSTDLSGAAVERMIERHVIERYHGEVLFPRLRGFMEVEDSALETSIRQMVDVDLSQVGITLSGDYSQRFDLSKRVSRGVEAFRKMNTAASPHDMLDSLLQTQKFLTVAAQPESGFVLGEKQTQDTAFSADILVSLLLVVVIRSPVQYLKARLAYMRDFVFVTEIDTGENGYALSTYEAVLGYLSYHSSGLKTASRANRALWTAAKKGDVQSLQSILEVNDSAVDMTTDEPYDSEIIDNDWEVRPHHNILLAESTGLGHVFPFQNQSSSSSGNHAENADHIKGPSLDRYVEQPTNDRVSYTSNESLRPKLKKKVSMDARTMSSSSGRSYLSGSSALLSSTSMVGETTPENLVQTQDVEGRSALFLAVERGHVQATKYLLGLVYHNNPSTVIEQSNNEGTTILVAAIQYGDRDLILAFLEWLFAAGVDQNTLQAYFRRQDMQGRCMAHYIFNCWWLIDWLEVRRHKLPWLLKDKKGQTPLYALCRSWDQDNYNIMVRTGLFAALRAQDDGEPLHLDHHVDFKNNTLLHITHDALVTRDLLYNCDSDPNWFSDKHLTPLMMASKFARIDQVRALFEDARVDLQARDHRGLTAVELAKDDEVRNKIDDMLLLSSQTRTEERDERTTTIVRSFFVDDGSLRVIIKSAAPNNRGTITVTTCRRSPAEFEALSRWLLLEHPASWMPSVSGFRSPFQIVSKPSRMILRDTQLRLDSFLKELLNHPTFATHEMVWEFFLVPDIDPAMLADRTHRKAEARVDKLREEYEPLIHSIPEVEAFVRFARDQVSGVHRSLKTLFRLINRTHNIFTDLFDAQLLVNQQVSKTLSFLPANHLQAFSRYVDTLNEMEHSPLMAFHYAVAGAMSTTTALQTALLRPGNIIGSINAAREQLSRQSAQASRSQRWPLAFGLLDDAQTRLQQQREKQHEDIKAVDKISGEIDMLGRELRYTNTTVVSELAGWQVVHAKKLRGALRDLAHASVITERARFDGMRSALRQIRRVDSA